MQPGAPHMRKPPDLPEPPSARDNGATAGGRLTGGVGRAYDVPEPEEGSHIMAQTNHPSVPVPPQQGAGEDGAEGVGAFRPRVVPDLEPEGVAPGAASEEFGEALPEG